MSPTTFDEGVTLMMSPKRRFTFRYMSLHSSHLSRRPSPTTCGLKLEYWPPGISCR